MSDRNIIEHEIENTPVEVISLRSKGRAAGCEQCGFDTWMPGDKKYVVEHWMNEDPMSRGDREHLCPACAVTRGLPFETYYYQNENSPAKEAKDLVFLGHGSCCRYCRSHSGSVHNGNYTLRGGIVEIVENGVCQFVCLSCVVEKGFLSVVRKERKASRKRERFEGGSPEDDDRSS